MLEFMLTISDHLNGTPLSDMWCLIMEVTFPAFGGDWGGAELYNVTGSERVTGDILDGSAHLGKALGLH